MWIGADGVSRSVALSDPESILDGESLAWLEQLSPVQIRSAVRRLRAFPEVVLSRLETIEYSAVELEFVDAPPPSDVKVMLGGRTRLDKQVMAQVDAIPLRWQVEVLFALLAVIWAIDDAARPAK